MACTPLTRRENDVLRLVVAGESNKAIARRLSIELGTVKSHMSTIMSKLGASSRVRVASIAVERGLLGTDDLPQIDQTILRAPSYGVAGMAC
jgi:two-component system NarL family response regulator